MGVRLHRHGKNRKDDRKDKTKVETYSPPPEHVEELKMERKVKRLLFEQFLKENELTLEQFNAMNPCTKDILKFRFRVWLYARNTS